MWQELSAGFLPDPAAPVGERGEEYLSTFVMEHGPVYRRVLLKLLDHASKRSSLI